MDGGITTTSEVGEVEVTTSVGPGDVGGSGDSQGHDPGSFGAAGEDLARTGSDSTAMLVGAGTVMLAVGAAALLFRRRLA